MKKILRRLLVLIGIVSFVFSGSSFGCPKPVVTSLSVNKGINTEVINLSITGSKFHKSTYVKLTKTGETDIVATDVKVVSATQVTCVLNLNGKAAGEWDVIVGNIGTFTKKEKPTLLAKGFIIEHPDLSLTGMEPSQADIDRVVTITVTGKGFRTGIKVMLSNEQMDIGATKVIVSSPANLTCEFNLKGAVSGAYKLRVVNDDGKTGVLDKAFTVNSPVPAEKPAPTPPVEPNPTLKPVFFDYDEWKLRSDQTEALNTSIGILKNNPKLYILLGGHADERGTREYNLDLSAKRAETVKSYLVARGISGNQIVIYAYGKDYPARKGAGEGNWSYNRRVDILVFDSSPTKDAGIKNLNQ